MSAQPDEFEFTFNIRDVDTEVLKNAPDGWLQTKITYKTDTNYKALRRSLTLPFKFVRKAGYLIRREVYRFGLAATLINMTIGRRNNDTWQYDVIYSGKLDLSKGSDGLTDYTCDSISNDFTIQLDAYDKVRFALPLTGVDVIEIMLPTLALAETCDFIMESSEDFRSNAFFAVSIANYKQFGNLSSVEQVGFVQVTAPDFTTDVNWFFQARINTSVRVYGNFFTSVGAGHWQCNIYRSSDGSLVRTLWDATLSITTQQNFTFDFICNVVAGEHLLLYYLNLTDGNSFHGIKMEQGTLSIQYLTGTPPTKCLGIRAYDVFKRLLQCMNIVSIYEPALPVPNQSYLLDPALDGEFKNLVYTCQDAVRAFFPDPTTGISRSTIVGALYQAGDQLQANGKYTVLGQDNEGETSTVYITYNSINYHEGEIFDWVFGQDTFTDPTGFGFVQQTASTPSLLMSFSQDLFQDVLALKGGQVGFGLQRGMAVFEDLSYFYRPGTGKLDLGTVDEKTKIIPAIDLMFNSIKGGYKDQQYDPTNAQSEVMSEVIYITDLQQPAKQLNLQAASSAAPFDIEITRVTPVDTSASRSDNRNFMIMISDTANEDGSFSPEPMQVLTSFSGVDKSYYNWRISPKQNLLRGGQYLRSIFDKMDGYTIRVSAPLKSTALSTTDSTGRIVSESANETISAAFGSQLFLPWYATVNAGLPIDAIDLIDQNPYSDIAFNWENVDARGYPVEINVDLGENSPQSFKLLLSPSNNMSNFIR